MPAHLPTLRFDRVLRPGSRGEGSQVYLLLRFSLASCPLKETLVVFWKGDLFVSVVMTRLVEQIG